MTSEQGRFYGKFRGWVTSTERAATTGQLGVRVPLGGDNAVEANAEACVPYAGESNGFYAIPPVGAGVWVEFVEGDPDLGAIWSGCWWTASGELPRALVSVPLSEFPVVLQSTAGNRIILGGQSSQSLVIETERGENGPRIVFSDSSLKISYGSAMTIELSHSQVAINGEALVVK